MNTRARLQQLVQQPGIIAAGSAYDCLSGLVLQKAGFSALHITGAGVSASLLGYPDLGLISLKEMATAVERIARSVDVPCIADGDTGFGGLLNVIRTIHEYEAAGAAGIHIEDQAISKRCGHLDGKELVPTVEFIQKIRACAQERTQADFLIIARTDAIAVNGLEDALDRARRALDVGADMVFIEAPRTMAEIERIARELEAPKLFNMVTGGKTPALSLTQLDELGYKMVIIPALSLCSAMVGMRHAAEEVLRTGTTRVLDETGFTVNDFFADLGIETWQEKERKYNRG